MHARVGTAMAAGLLLGSPVLWGQQAGPGDPPVFRTKVELVTVDVTVVDRDGRPVRGLDASDFAVTVDGEPRRIVTTEFVDAAAARAEEGRQAGGRVSSNESAGVGRMFVFVVDQNTLEPGQVRRVASAATRLLGELSFSDRSALILLPNGPNIPFTWAHDRIQDALKRVVGTGTPVDSDVASLSEARDMANGGLHALRSLAVRQCGGPSSDAPGLGSDTVGAIGATPTGPGQAPAPSPGAPGGGQAGGTSGASGGGEGRAAGGAMPGDGFGDNCARDAQMRAEWAWRNAQLTSLSSIAGMRNALAALSRVPGDKTVILVSGGWPLDDREEQFLVTQVASDAAAARATIFSLFVPDAPFEAARRTPSPTVVDDQQIQSQPLEHLASLTGGGTFRAYVGAEEAFGRMAREVSAYYRIGVEKTVYDNDGRNRRMKVRVSRHGATVRARDLFDTRTYEDRDWTARLASALEAPVVATGIGLRVTSYITADPDDPARLQVVLAGEASRVGAGDATFRLIVQDLEGRKVLSGDQPIGEPTDEGLTFSARAPLPPGRYVARLAVIDGTGRTGSVEHLLDVRQDSLGDIGVTGPILVRVPAGAQRNPRLALADTRQDERLAMQVHLNGAENRLSNAEVVFEVAASADGRALIETGADISPGPRSSWVVAQGIADLRVLPPGRYVARARIAADGKPLGEVRRAFVVSGGRGGAPAVARASAPTTVARTGAPRLLASIPAPAARFTPGTALAPAVLDPFLERVAARPDAGSQDVRELLARARASGVTGLSVPDALASEQPVAAFLKGLAQLADHQVNPAATTFRDALRAAPDLYPAMVYLGVCYAAAGRDKEAAAAWRTSLIKEGDTRVLHVLLTDALLRQQQGESALRVVEAARARWPADEELKRRFVTAALLAGRYDEGFEALDELVQANAEDESTLLAGLLVLYESIDAGTPVQGPDDDRARMARLADVYRERGGTSVALVDTWLAAARKP